MASPFGRAHIIVNPRAGRGAVERGWPAVREVLDGDGVAYDVTVTERPGHGTEAARRAVEGGCTFVVAVGGDGTVHEVVNGLMDDEGPRNPATVLGVVAAGSGCDFVKTFGLPQDPADAARHLLGDTLWGKIDVGRIRCEARGGDPITRWFANIAEAGIGAEVVDAASRMPKFLGGSVYRIAALKTLARFKPKSAHVAMRGRETRGKHGEDETLSELGRDGTWSMLVVANGQFFGGGMRVAPRAVPGDGLFEGRGREGHAEDVQGRAHPEPLHPGVSRRACAGRERASDPDRSRRRSRRHHAGDVRDRRSGDPDEGLKGRSPWLSACPDSTCSSSSSRNRASTTTWRACRSSIRRRGPGARTACSTT
ncbi:MAG: diacylglycerol kinase family lipid kinase [Actinobacteria bacterium]|nr:MAG: diacylglycerol kinase family lipid kinase [Actinomycetota bacterium]